MSAECRKVRAIADNDDGEHDEEHERGGVTVARSDPPRGDSLACSWALGRRVGWTAGDGTTDGKRERAERCRA